MTLLHEITHILIRTKKGNSDSYFYTTIEFDSSSSLWSKESGLYLEKILFDKVEMVYTTKSSEFILEYKNWCQPLEKFKTNFIKLYDESIKTNDYFSLSKTKSTNCLLINNHTYICN